MKRLFSAYACACAYIMFAYADDPQHGGLYFDAAVEVDGVQYPAKTTIYAESWPTQMLVKPALAEGQYFMWYYTGIPRTTYR